MNAWSHLPNAKHIDQVLSDLRAHPEEFAAAWSAARAAAWSAAKDAARAAAWSAAWSAAWDADRDTAWDVARDMASDAARSVAWSAAWAAATALISWDHSGKYLHMTYEQLEVWYHLSKDPAALLLLPYVRARELIEQKAVA